MGTTVRQFWSVDNDPFAGNRAVKVQSLASCRVDPLVGWSLIGQDKFSLEKLDGSGG